jgi:predicted DNA-binding transcriptional regulator YafY
MAHTWEVEMELLQYNDMVEVLEPVSLRDMMIEHAWNMLKLYNEV